MPRQHPLGAVLFVTVLASAAVTIGITASTSDSSSPFNHVASASIARQAAPQQPTATFANRAIHQQVNTQLGVSRSDLMHLDVAGPMLDERTIDVLLDGESVTVDLWPHSVRAADYRVRIQVDDGSLVDVAAGPERTVRGVIREIPGSQVAGAVYDDGLHAGIFLPDNRAMWMEPVSQHVAGADGGLHVLYNAADADCESHECGVPQQWIDQFLAQQQDQGMNAGEGGVAGSDNCMFAEIAADADFSYYQTFGSSVSQVEDRINLLINLINSNQYEQQVGIIHVLTEIIVRTSSSANPYSSSEAGTLLSQFRNVWSSPPESQIPRAVAHLFTGQNLNGTTIGVAWLGTVCQSPNGQSYSLSQHFTPLSCMSDLVAHELGHNWGSPHCTCSGTTMNPSITCGNTFASTSINSILNYKNSVSCLSFCVSPVQNNECQSRQIVSDGDTPFSTIGATTEGPDEPTLCTLFANPTIQNDAWFAYTATCTGDLAVSLCGSGFQAKLGVYEGSNCPTQPDTIDACDAFSCTENTLPEVILPVVEGDSFVIRVGGLTDQEGEGILSITCEEPSTGPDCPGDLNDDGEVNVVDLLELLGNWGSCDSPDQCPGDLNDDNEVNVVDLLTLLGEWGPCV